MDGESPNDLKFAEATLEQFAIVSYAVRPERVRPHGVLIQRRTEFTIYLPPGRSIGGNAYAEPG